MVSKPATKITFKADEFVKYTKCRKKCFKYQKIVEDMSLLTTSFLTITIIIKLLLKDWVETFEMALIIALFLIRQHLH